ncbi:hypothetical protein FSP39_012336 [Pinctada imbricata]|uniref:Uncharacterized protein n=1 Tax=Pinctada imbricata TaxID=66713 RepID=A0AA88YNY8_PINIB|nr:hypothetical protein FSP39_012336 [Pinctada imbricata]
MLRKMQALEGQFQRMRRELRLMENRLPKLVNDQSQYSKKVDRIEFTLSRTGTYYKRLEDRVHVLESRLSTDENAILDTQRRVTSPDTLMDPVRPYIVAEMQKYKDDVHQSVVNEIVPTIIASNNSFLSDLKDDILKQLKNDMLSTLNHHQYMNNTGKSPVIKRTDTDAVKLTDKITVKQNDTSSVKALEVLARSLRRLNIGGNTSLYNDTNIKDDGSSDFDRGEWSNYNGNNTSLEVDNTTDSQIDLRDVENIIVESLNKIKQDILQSTRRNLRTMSQKLF